MLSHQGRRVVAAALIAVATTALCGAGIRAGRLDAVQQRWEDLLQPGLGDDPDVVVVAIDRSALADTGGSWPWPRDRHAALLDAIGENGPAVVAYDVLFAGTGPDDGVLAAALERTPTVLATAHRLAPQPDGPPVVVDTVVAADALTDAAHGTGHANVTLSADRGVVRSLPLYALDDRGIARPSIALAAVVASDAAAGPLIERPDGVQAGTRFIPLDDGELLINWSDKLTSADVIPADDVLSGTVERSRIEGRIVFVGVTEPTAGDQHLVPVDQTGATPGVVVMANAANTILSAGYLTPAGTTDEMLVVMALAALTAVLFVWARLAMAVAGAAAQVVAVVAAASWQFHSDGELWNVVWPSLAVVTAGVGGTGWRYVTEIRHRRRALQLFAAYMPAGVVAELDDPRSLTAAAEGRRLDVSVVFCDLRGFTPVAAELEPSQVRELLDRYYTYTVDVVHNHAGTVMQFVGDEVFAVFGAPIPEPAAADRAVRSAIALQQQVGRLDAALGAVGLASVRFGVGVHHGPAVAAHVGTANRRQYSVIGDTVNVGSRLCNHAERGEVVVSAEAAAAALPATAALLRAAGTVELKGVARAVTILRWHLDGPSGRAEL